ncbi:MAG: hypothetical protein FWG99_09660 [Treponema sp.]|nr:hypothetical protein [Treponema sp.]
MKKPLMLIPVFLFAIGAVYPQGIQPRGDSALSQNIELTILQMDVRIKRLAGDINSRLAAEESQKVAVGQFAYMGSITQLSVFWANQLTEELTNIPNKSFTLLSGDYSGADWTISGEIVELAGIIRIYSRLIRSGSRSVEAAFHSDFERNQHIAQMLSVSEGSSSSYRDDLFEPDSWEHPVSYEIGIGTAFLVIYRSIQEGDEDFFLLIPDQEGRLVMETTGSIDTYMEFYDAETGEMLDQNDDGGQGNNARIRYNVRAGHRYIAKVRGYSSGTTGNYGFRAYIGIVQGHWDAPVHYEIGGNERHPVMERTLLADDEEYFLLVPAEAGRLIVETTGDTDTYIEFYDAESRELLTQNDDGGSDYNARIRYNVQAGHRYMAKVRGYSSDSSGDYGFRAYLTELVDLAPDQYEPDDDHAQANMLEIGVPQQHNFHHADDVDWVKFIIERSGGYTIRAGGTISNRLDTYIELLDENLNPIDGDDDGGEYRDSLLSVNLESGLYYLKVFCLDDEPDQNYIISIEVN